MKIAEPKVSGVVRRTGEYQLAIHAMGNGENVEIPVHTMAKIKNPYQALLQALRRYIRKWKLPYEVWAKENVVYVRRKQS